MTDNITIPRATVQQALEALEDLGMRHFENTGEKLYADIYIALRTALKQQAEPVAWPQLSDDMEYAAQDEFHILPPRMKRLWKRMQELYTTPPQRKPLMDEQADQIISGLQTCHHQSSKREFLKVWLRDWAAHGIKEGA